MSPSDNQQGIELDCKTLYDIATRFSPVLRFHPQERFFPVLAESWLTHTTEAPWTSDSAHWLGDFSPDPNRRGMALCRFTDGQLDVIAGQPVAGHRPLQLSIADDDPYAIGASALRTVDETTFLDLAGWDPSSNFGAGDTDRLYALYSELSAAMNDQIDWTPLHGRGDRPHAWIPASVNPTTYCEATWAGRFHVISDSAGEFDFPPGDGSLDNYLALTYHYLYPALETPPDGNSGRWLEGQWESVTLFFRGEGLGKLANPIVLVPFDFVVVSQNVVEANNSHHTTALAGYALQGNWPSFVEHLGEHPVLYVSRGTHKFYFTPADAGTPPPSPHPGSDPGAHSDDPHAGGDTDYLVLGLILLWLAALIVIAAVALAIILIILAITLFLLWLISLIMAHINDGAGTPLPGSTPNDEAGDDGTQGGGTETPAGSAPPTDGGGGGGPSVGLPNTGSPTGQATVSFDVRVIDRIFPERPPPTGYPSAELCENPTWWDYSGGWGIHVQGGFGTGWENGTRRVDEFGRSLAYWNGLRLSTVLHGGAAQG